MKKENIINGLILFFMGCFIIYTGQFSVALGVPVQLGNYKYLLASVFFVLSLCLFIERGSSGQ